MALALTKGTRRLLAFLAKRAGVSGRLYMHTAGIDVERLNAPR
jgi:hypothetical protein